MAAQESADKCRSCTSVGPLGNGQFSERHVGSWSGRQGAQGGLVNASDLQRAEGLAAWLEAAKFGPQNAGRSGCAEFCLVKETPMFCLDSFLQGGSEMVYGAVNRQLIPR